MTTEPFPPAIGTPCATCGERLPAMFGGAYDNTKDPSFGGARVYCCPTCILRLGWKRALRRALSMLRSWEQQKEAKP